MRFTFIGVIGINKVMSRWRFEALCRYMHVNNNDMDIPRGEMGHDPLFKIRPLLTSVKETFKGEYRPERDISIDEAMVGYKGRSHIKQYIPSKPTKWGFKVWCLAMSSNGYVLDISVYTGKRNKPSNNGLGYDVVMELSKDYSYKFHHLYFDNFFASIKLLHDLQKQNIYACATVRVNRKGLPEEIKKPGKLQRGDSIIRQSAGGELACVWYDKRDVRMIATNCQPTETTVRRRVGSDMQDIKCPSMIVNYNKNMGGVDLADQNRSYYKMGRHAKKYWKALFWYVLDTCIINSYVIYKETVTNDELVPVTHLKFRMELSRQLINGYSCRSTTRSNNLDPTGHVSSEHSLVRNTKSLVCRNCSQLGQKTPSGFGVRSSYKCNSCNIPLCQNNCFIQYHQRHMS